MTNNTLIQTEIKSNNLQASDLENFSFTRLFNHFLNFPNFYAFNPQRMLVNLKGPRHRMIFSRVERVETC